MIDIGRKNDMQMLMRFVNDPNEPLFRRRKAFRTMQSIKHKMSDTTVQKLRLRLIAANMNNDSHEVEKISMRLQDYERKHHTLRKY